MTLLKLDTKPIIYLLLVSITENRKLMNCKIIDSSGKRSMENGIDVI